MKYDRLCWIERIDDNLFRLGLSEQAHDFLGVIANIEVCDQDCFELGHHLVSISGSRGAMKIYAPMQGDIVSTNTTALRSIMQRPLSPGARGGWIVEFAGLEDEFEQLSDEPINL
jgi:glycine cleavage system H lipoate-binding protein